jgi:LuxR family maltose regulon positive regulatory protein
MTSTEAATNAAPLLLTKLHAPRRRREVVYRSRLNSRLSRARQPALTLVSAPAGFGKTTLLGEWFGESDGDDRSTAWLSLDARDNDPAVFWSYVVAALQTVAPAVGETAMSLLHSSQSLESVVAALLNDLGEVTSDVVLVLDDYHVIESADLQHSMRFLLEHLPPQVRLVLASRSDPPLPLARLRARGELLEIRAADLRFTTGEAASYLNEAMGLDLGASDVSVLENRTEGWIAALQLAALSMQGRDDVARFIENFTGDDRFVVDYLAEEVLERQTDDVRSFLLQTAILGRLTGSLCDHVTAMTGGKATLDMLDRANMFLVPLDDHRRWYRYHHLFADVLRARLLDERPGQLPELHRRASDWYEANGDRPEAIGHAAAGHHFDRAAQLIEIAAPEMRRTRQEATLQRWLGSLPEHLLQDRPVLSTALVGARMATGDPTGVERLLEMVEPWLGATSVDRDRPGAPPIVFDHDEFARLPAQVAIYRAALALLAGDTASTIEHARRALALADNSDHIRRGSAAALLGLAHWATGDLESARARYSNAVESFVRADFIPDVLGCSLALADIQMALGRLGDARRTLEAGLRHAGRFPALRGTADMHVGLSEVLVEQNDLDGAARHLKMSSDLSDQAGLPQHAYRSRVALARLGQARGDTDGAIDLLEDAERVYNSDFSPAVRPIAALKARLQATCDDVAGARRWAAERGLTADDDLNYVREFEHITLARILLNTNDADGRTIGDAIGLLDRLLEAAERGQRAASAIEILVLLSVAHLAGDDRQAAEALLEQALVRAESEGYVRVFVDGVPSLGALLTAAAQAGAAGKHARRVLASVQPADTTTVRSDLFYELSRRELDVLRLLRSDLGGPEIARELHVSLNTLRTHTKNIYTKLGVTNRREAVRRAAELRL